jgi:hypothetical protein
MNKEISEKKVVLTILASVEQEVEEERNEIESLEAE